MLFSADDVDVDFVVVGARLIRVNDVGVGIAAVPGSGDCSDNDDNNNEKTDRAGVFTKQLNGLAITCVSRSIKPVVEFLEMCRRQAKTGAKENPQIRIYDHDGCRYWHFRSNSPLRPLSSVHLDRTIKNDLLEDIKEYLSSRTRLRYQQRNIPYQRGYLLHGPPGTGKSTLASALAGRYDLSLYVLELSHINDQDLKYRPRRDGLGRCRQWQQQEEKERHNDSECTLSGILNALDGVGSQEGRIVIMTTNFPSKLDKALVRPGRIDKKIYIGYISRKSAEEMFVRMFQPLKKDKKANKSVSISTSNTAVQDGGYKGLSQASDAEHNLDQEKIYNWDVCSCDECKTIDLTTQAAEFAQLMPENSITLSELQGFFQARLGCPNKAMRQFSGWLCEMNAEKVKQR
ncbi:mitochondrial chaperone bcs1 [Apiospora kogelbergensis]|uniref:mitochondrial chaperone bcs1 n=1 Tax=Apiospora kogelbergensis TaxID=1337665 RepID=UPI00312D2FC4